MRVGHKLGLIENMGFYDRVTRAVVGVLLNLPLVLHTPLLSYFQIDVTGIEVYASAISFYFLLTALLGWDPFYAMFKIKSCGGSGRNRCGSFQYQAEAAMGNNPTTDKNYEVRGLKPGEQVTKGKYDKEQGIVL